MRESLAPVLRAAGVTALVVGIVVLLLNPPSLSGAGELAALLAGGLVFVLLSAWITVALIGREGMSEPEMERLIRRSEHLARRSPRDREADEFDALVSAAIDRLPDDFRRLLAETPVVVSSHGADAGAYGHYFGDTVARQEHEDRIVLYRDTLERDFGHDPELLSAQVERTLRHELAHHLGWAEEGVRGLGL